MNAHSPSGSGYWYGPDDRLDPPGAVLQALREYRNAEVARRRSARDSMGMGETDLLALRYLLRAQAGGERVGPKDLSRVLGITTASTTSLIDRLVGSGLIQLPEGVKDMERHWRDFTEDDLFPGGRFRAAWGHRVS